MKKTKKELWETQFVAREVTTPSLEGAYTSCYDKWGALLYQRNTFGKLVRIYSNKTEYLNAIKGAGKV